MAHRAGDRLRLLGHKVCGPTGIGVVYGKQEVLEHMPPSQGGGHMFANVTFEKTIFQGSPERFEAGAANIADAVGLGTPLDCVESTARHIYIRWPPIETTLPPKCK
jgi:cysteine desulfurase/selenocysteine lyase